MGISGSRFSVSDVEARCAEGARMENRRGNDCELQRAERPRATMTITARVTDSKRNTLLSRELRCLHAGSTDPGSPGQRVPSQALVAWVGAHLIEGRVGRSPDRRKSCRSVPSLLTSWQWGVNPGRVESLCTSSKTPVPVGMDSFPNRQCSDTRDEGPCVHAVSRVVAKRETGFGENHRLTDSHQWAGWPGLSPAN